MKLSRVELVSSNYDPAKDSGGLQAARTTFLSADGYDMELRDGYVTIAHSSRTAIYSLGQVKNALQATEQPAVPPFGLQSGEARAATIDAFEAAGHIDAETARQLREEPLAFVPPDVAAGIAISTEQIAPESPKTGKKRRR